MTAPPSDEKEETDRPDENRPEPEPGSPRLTPETLLLLVDPVVSRGGDSYERTEVLARVDINISSFYENRALASIIEERKKARAPSRRRSLSRRVSDGMDAIPMIPSRGLSRRVSDGLEAILPAAVTGGGPDANASDRPLSEAFYCVITSELMHEPTIDPDGYTFERNAIISWIRSKGTSPVTRNAVSERDLRPNGAIRILLNVEAARPDGEIHPSVAKWREEEPKAIQDLNLPTQEEIDALLPQVRIFLCVFCCIILFRLAIFLFFFYVAYNYPLLGLLWLVIEFLCYYRSGNGDSGSGVETTALLPGGNSNNV